MWNWTYKFPITMVTNCWLKWTHIEFIHTNFKSLYVCFILYDFMHKGQSNFFFLTWPKWSYETLSSLGVRCPPLTVTFYFTSLKPPGKLEPNLVEMFIGFSFKKFILFFMRNTQKKQRPKMLYAVCQHFFIAIY
jgi:hypothetical protein